MPSPADRKYSESHEWLKVEGSTVTLGISKFAVDQLTDVTYVQLKPKGTKVNVGDSVGEVESVKTTSDVYAHVAGEIIEVNSAVVDNPALLNEDPYTKGWLVKLKVSDTSALNSLMDSKAYDAAHPT